MDRTNVSDNSATQQNGALERLQNEAVPAKPMPEQGSKGVQDYIAEAVHSAVYTGIQEPISGISQIVDEFAGTKLQPKMQFMSAPEKVSFGGADWHAQQIGGAVGTLLPFLLVRKGVRGALGASAEEAGLMSARTAFNMNLKEAALTGFAYDALLRPSQPTKGDLSQFILDRGTQGAIGAGTFATMTAAGLGLKQLSGTASVERSALLPILRNPIANGALSGIPAGLFNAEANALAKDHRLASTSELAQSAYGMTLIGGGFGLAHSLKGTESGAKTNLESRDTRPTLFADRLGLKLAGGDTVAPEGAKFSVAPESLQITVKPSSFTELANRISGFETTTEPLLVSKPGAPTKFESTADFMRDHVTQIDTPVRVYSLEGHSTKVVVPESYAKQLDGIRQFRLGLEGAPPEGTKPIEPGLLHRALPEDFIPHLDALPNSRLIEKLYLVNEPNPLDPLHKRASGDPQFESQAAAQDNSVTFFRKNVDASLGDEVRHEWSHIARETMPTESAGYDLSAQHEGKTYVTRPRAMADNPEWWSVNLGEEMLAPQASRFIELTNQAPLQSVMLAEGLKRTLAEAPESAARNQNVLEIQNRIRYVDEMVRPKVIEQLVNDVREPRQSGADTSAAKLLMRLGEGQRLNDIPSVKTLDLSREPINNDNLNQLANNRNLENLDLSSTQVGGYSGGFTVLETMPLKSLGLAGTQTTGSMLRPLERIKTLESLDLSGTNVGDNGLSSLSRMRNLKQLDLRGTEVSSEGVQWLQERLPQTEIRH